ncbi:autotransporter domain-containing protein [Sebaldella sp. S0638]|uniref:autotransporter domain-containing protein n=1 Tax=Sebaldella sp. S0638 TaxID=2957809 RepID=UPI00209F97EE|nr:autotransporter domain-containing protein [Sebaldella sp. S0638]MCP1222966.1 autotransporter domain-containing protein [Sebaldella sp. S0638]
MFLLYYSTTQNDYVVKPEYLEWQIFTSGFYNNSQRGGKKDTITMNGEGRIKSVDLGMVIPVKGINRNGVELNLTPVNEPELNINTVSVLEPQISDPVYKYTGISVPAMPRTPSINFSYPNSYDNQSIGGYAFNTGYYTSGNKIFENLDVSTSETTINLNGETNIATITGAATYSDGSSYNGTTADSYTHTTNSNNNKFVVHELGGARNTEISGKWNMTLTNGTRNNAVGFLSYRPAYYNGGDYKTVFSGDLNLQVDSTSTSYTITSLIGMSLDLSNVYSTPTKAVLENTGTITIKRGNQYGQSGIAMQLDRGSSSTIQTGELINSGTINIESSTDTSYGTASGVVGSVGVFVTVDKLKNEVLVKPGNINVDGVGNRGVETGGYIYGSTDYLSSKIEIDGSTGKIIIGGKNNTAFHLGKSISESGISLADNVKNLDIVLNGESSMGVVREATGTIEKTMDLILNDKMISSIEFGGNSKSSAIFYSYREGTTIIDSSLENSLTPINSGQQNAIALGNNGSNIKNYMPIKIGSGAKAMAGLVSNGGRIENYADIENNSSAYTDVYGNNYGGTALASMYYMDDAMIVNTGNITMNGDYSTGILNSGNIATTENDHIIVNGKNATAIYSGFGYNYNSDASKTEIKANKLEANGENSTVIYANGSEVKLGSSTIGSPLEVKADGKDAFAYFIKDYNNNGNYKGKMILTSDVNTEIKNGALGFYVEGTDPSTTINVGEYLKGIVDTTNGNLTMNISDDSYRMVLNKASIKLSDLSDISNGSGINFTGSDASKIIQSSVEIDIDSNIDKNNITGDKTYRNQEIGKSGITVKEGITISGTEDGLAGIAQEFASTDTHILSSTNNGTIKLEGNNSLGMYTKRSSVRNNGLIDLSGTSGVGLYSILGVAQNTGTIKVGDKGVGMYASTNVDISEVPYYTPPASLENSGKIIAEAGSNAVGMYINNASPNGYTDGGINIDNGEIDVSASKGGIGIYATTNAEVSGSDAKISVGENGTGIYSKNGYINVFDLELNLKGDNSTGIYADSSSFYGSVNANVDGKGIIVINKEGTSSSNLDSINVTSTEGSEYIVQNIKDNIISYNNNASLGSGGIFAAGTNSVVYLGENSNLTSSGQAGMIGIALNGKYTNGLPVRIDWYGNYAYKEATNKGTINFGNNSVGIYVVDGAGAQNDGSILLGDNSVGLYGKGSGSSIANTGTVEVGGNSSGLYLKDGNSVLNSGTIRSTGDNVTGINLDGTSDITTVNVGNINLSGNKSIGIYVSDGGNKVVDNYGYIEIGDSTSVSDPSIAIYNNNSNGVINNASSMILGKNSIGIYNNAGKVTHTSGDLYIEEAGTGIYTNSGNVSLSGGKLTLNGANTVGIYSAGNSAINNAMALSVSDNSYGIVLDGKTSITNSGASTVGENGVLLYASNESDVVNEAGGSVYMTGSDSAAFYMVNGGSITNRGNITADTGTANIGIYSKSGSIYNSGDIKIGSSVIVDKQNPYLNKYAVGIYGDSVQNMENSGNIEAGTEAVGMYVTNNINEALNKGNIFSSSEKAIGIYSSTGSLRNEGNITMSGSGSIGIAAERASTVTNAGTITMNGNDNIGIYANVNSKVINESTGKIYINGNDSVGVQLSGGSTLENYGLISVASGTINSTDIVKGKDGYTPPSIINAGVIKVDEKFELDGYNLIVKPDPTSFRKATMEEITINDYSLDDINAGFLLSNKVSFVAPSFDFGNNAVKIDPLFTQGTNARVYKFENVFDPSTPDGGTNYGEISVSSNSLTFDAIPVVNSQGKVDIWMEKINYDEFTNGAWYDEFAKNIEGKYLNAEGDALKIYDKLDLITDAGVLGNSFEQLAGNMYSNINQREQDIAGVFNNALTTLQNSTNNTKENVKINIIGGKGSTSEDTTGVESYSYNSVGALALREVERTYRHTFGYSLGYVRTDFQMKDTKNEEEVNTIQLGLHNKYSVNGWNIKNDILGRAGFHSSDREVAWYDGTKSKLSADYNVYGVSSLNEVGRDIELGKNLKVTPFAGLELGYMTHDSFKEKGGIESLKVDSNDGYSVKPSIGVRLNGEAGFGSSKDVKLKGNIGVAYEYELGNMNEQERASLEVIETGYHKLAQPAEDKGRIKTTASVGVEVNDRYGIFLNGEYGMGNANKEDYKVGISFKAAF